MSYKPLSFSDMKFLAYGVSRHYITAKMTSLPFKNVVIPFKFDLDDIKKTCANFNTLVTI